MNLFWFGIRRSKFHHRIDRGSFWNQGNHVVVFSYKPTNQCQKGRSSFVFSKWFVCHDPSLGLTTQAKAHKGRWPRGV
jgi:hypothetical protein